MTAYPMGSGDREEEDLSRSRNEGFGHEAETAHEEGHVTGERVGDHTGDPYPEDGPYDTADTAETAETPRDETPKDDDLLVAGDPAPGDTPADDGHVDAVPVEAVPADVPSSDVPADLPRTNDEDRSLFEEGYGEGFRKRWQEVQANFVDDPYETVRQAEQLADEVVTSLTTALTERKRELDDRWSNEKDNTEELRQSLRGYRTLLDRLLAL
ncbi:hypothetical protein [Actinocorallia longicatena]|uniref:Uncharacterized protein n=1 Tax=Actinocorallia longicatena TaxID=111803 RepID=A0ABP6Q698_9ACTN